MMMSKSDSLELLKQGGHLDYGSVIPKSVIYEAFGITPPNFPAMLPAIKRFELEELAVASYIRNSLLNEGKYLKGETNSYRVLLPSENAGQVLKYMESADRKLKRALKLNRTTPSEYKISNNDEVRLMMKKESMK